MPRPAAMIESLAKVFVVVKAMQADGLEWSEVYRPCSARRAGSGAVETSVVIHVDVDAVAAATDRSPIIRKDRSFVYRELFINYTESTQRWHPND